LNIIRSGAQFLSRHSHVNWALADQAMVSGVNFLTGILLARYLGIGEFGRFTLVWMSVLFVNSINHAMINSPMMSIGPKQSEAEAPTYYGAVIVQQVIFSCVVSFLLFCGAQLSGMVFPEWRMEGLALPLATAALALQFQDFLRRYFFTWGRAAEAFANDAIRYLGQIAVLIWLFLAFQDSVDTAKVIWVIAITAASATVCGAFFIARIEVNAEILRATTSRHWHFSKWLTGSALMQWATGNFFIITAGALLGASAVGALRAAQNLMGVVHILFLGLENIVPIRASQLFHEKGKKTLCDYLKRVTLFGAGATAAVAVIAAATPELWLRLVFGTEYQGYGYLLQWYAVIYVLSFLNLPLRAGLRAMEHAKCIFWAYIWMTLFSIIAAYPITTYLGLTGVVGGIVVISIIQASTLWFGLKKRLGLNT
jgi:O-antigen/teichoic acid export membrane protein